MVLTEAAVVLLKYVQPPSKYTYIHIFMYITAALWMLRSTWL